MSCSRSERPDLPLVDDLTATMIRAGLSTSRQVWTGQPEHLVEMLDEVAGFVMRAGGAS